MPHFVIPAWKQTNLYARDVWHNYWPMKLYELTALGQCVKTEGQNAKQSNHVSHNTECIYWWKAVSPEQAKTPCTPRQERVMRVGNCSVAQPTAVPVFLNKRPKQCKHWLVEAADRMYSTHTHTHNTASHEQEQDIRYDTHSFFKPKTF